MKIMVLIVLCFVVSAILIVVGLYKAVHVHELLMNFGKNSKPGSSGGGYPAYDEAWMFLGSGSVSLATGITMLVWRRKK